MKIHCRTNLDLSNEKWPDDLPCLPSVGHLIQSETDHSGFKLELEVVGVTWRKSEKTWGPDGYSTYWVPTIELHTPNGMPIHNFFEWYAPRVGREVEDFI